MRNILNPVRSVIQEISNYDPIESANFWKSRQSAYLFATSAIIMLLACAAPVALISQLSLVYCGIQAFRLMYSMYRDRSERKGALLQKMPRILLVLAAAYTASPLFLALTFICIYLSHTKLSQSWNKHVPQAPTGQFFKKNAASLSELGRSSKKLFHRAAKQISSYDVLEKPRFWKSTHGVYFFAATATTILLLSVLPYALITKLAISYCSVQAFRLIRSTSKKSNGNKAMIRQALPRIILLLAAVCASSPFLLSFVSFSVFLSHTKISKLWENLIPQSFKGESPTDRTTSQVSKPEQSGGQNPVEVPDSPTPSVGVSSFQATSPEETSTNFGFGNSSLFTEAPTCTQNELPALPESLVKYYQDFRGMASDNNQENIKSHLRLLTDESCQLAKDLKTSAAAFSDYARNVVMEDKASPKNSSVFLSNLIPDFKDLADAHSKTHKLTSEQKKSNAEKTAAVNALVFCYLCFSCIENKSSPSLLIGLLHGGSSENQHYSHNFYSHSASYLTHEKIKPGSGTTKTPHEKKIATFFKLFEVLVKINSSFYTAEDLKSEISAINASAKERFKIKGKEISSIFNHFSGKEVSRPSMPSSNL